MKDMVNKLEYQKELESEDDILIKAMLEQYKYTGDVSFNKKDFVYIARALKKFKKRGFKIHHKNETGDIKIYRI